MFRVWGHPGFVEKSHKLPCRFVFQYGAGQPTRKQLTMPSINRPTILYSMISVATVLLASLQNPSSAAGPAAATGNPDFTKGDTIPEGAIHDWNLGATGARGWMFCDKLVTTDARQIYDHEVEKDSPAEGFSRSAT
jgi:hypothetical protein